MKKKTSIMLFVMIIFASYSCEEEGLTGSDPIEECEFTERVGIIVNDIKLTFPQTMGDSFQSFFGNNYYAYTITDLNHVMWEGPYQSGNNAQIQTTMSMDDSICIGTNTEYFSEGSPYIGGYFLEILLPNSGNFLGTLTMSIRSDDFRSDNFSQGEYVLWTETSNDPFFDGINGTIPGTRQVFNSTGSKISSKGIFKEGTFVNY